MRSEVKSVMVQAENCLMLLLPHPDDFDIYGLKSPDYRYPDTVHPLADKSELENGRSQTLKKKVKTDCGSTCGASHSSCLTPDGSEPETEDKEMTSYTSNYIIKDSGDSGKDHSKEGDTAGANSDDVPCGTYKEKSSNTSNLNTDNAQEDEKAKRCDCTFYDSRKDDSRPPLDGDSAVKQENSHMSEKFKEGEEVEGEDHCESSEEFEEISSGESEDSDGNQDVDELVRGHGLGSKKYNLTLDLSLDSVQLRETPDNTDVLHTLKDIVQLVNIKFLPLLQKWLEIFTKAGNQEDNIRKAIDLKQLAQKIKERICKLKVVKMKRVDPEKTSTSAAAAAADSDDDGDDEEDFEEVPQKEGYELHIPDHLREEYGLVKQPPKPSTSKEWAMPGSSQR